MRDKYAYVPAAAPVGGGVQQRLADVRQYTIDFFANKKIERKAQAGAAVTQLQTAIGVGGNLVPAFRTYEAAHLDIGNLPRAQMTAALVAYVKQSYSNQYPAPIQAGGASTWASLAAQPRATVDLVQVHGQAGQWDVRATVREPANAAPVQLVVGRVYEGEARFVALAVQPAGRSNDVYTRQGAPNQHYIRYQRGGVWRFLRRYVVRGLNQSDSEQIAAGADLLAPHQNTAAHANEIRSPAETGRHNVAANAALTVDQQILSHTRGWQKRFVSTTTTMRPVYSTRGEEFRSVFGKVIVDLAFVPGADIYDLHAPAGLAPFGVTGATLHNRAHQPDPARRTIADEMSLAARDVIRTREVLIHLRVPNAAVQANAGAQTIIAMWHDGNAVNGDATFNAVETAWHGTHVPAATETLSYRWGGNRWYKFYRFANAAAANNAWAAIPGPQQNRRAWYNEYDFPAPLPAGFQR